MGQKSVIIELLFLHSFVASIEHFGIFITHVYLILYQVYLRTTLMTKFLHDLHRCSTSSRKMCASFFQLLAPFNHGHFCRDCLRSKMYISLLRICCRNFAATQCFLPSFHRGISNSSPIFEIWRVSATDCLAYCILNAPESGVTL